MLARARSLALLLFGSTALACGDDSSSADGDAGGTAGAESGDTTAGPTTDSPTSGADDACACDDADPCTIDTCDGGACTHEPELSNACRPTIDVTFPPRAATIAGAANTPSVTVTGTVASGLGTITALSLNGEPVTVAADGSFAHDVAVDVGGNVLVFETEDDAGNKRRRVQSFLWSTGFRKPTTPPDGVVPEGLGFWLAQESLDDGDHSLPVDDLATALELALGTFDTSAFASTDSAIASQAGYDVYLTSLELGSASVALAGADGGIRLDASLSDIVGDLEFDCTNFGCQLAGGDGTGGLSIEAVQVTGTLLLSASPDHQLAATLVDVDAVVDPDDVNIWSNNVWTNILLSVVELFIHDSLVASLEGALEDQVQAQLGPALANGLAALTLATTFEFPNLGNARKSIPVDLAADFTATDFHDGVAPPADSPPQGGAVVLRAGGYPTLEVTAYDNLGVPERVGCGLAPQSLTIPRQAPLEIALADDTLNELLYAGWRGGLLEVPLGGINGGGLIEDLDVQVSGMLAPTVSDCGPTGTLLATIGDIAIAATFTINGNPVQFDAFTTLVVRVDIQASENGIVLDLAEVERVETELTADESNIAMEASFVDLLEAQLVNGLLGQLGTTGFGAISLPQIDLSGMLGLPPGTAMLTIHTDSVTRENGTSVIVGRF
jgi:hypothetical protein